MRFVIIFKVEEKGGGGWEVVGRWLGGWTERGGGGHRGECWMFKHTRLFNLIPKIPHARETHHTCSPVPRGRVLSEQTRFLQPRGRDLGEQKVPAATGTGLTRTKKFLRPRGGVLSEQTKCMRQRGGVLSKHQKELRSRVRVLSEHKSACGHGGVL